MDFKLSEFYYRANEFLKRPVDENIVKIFTRQKYYKVNTDSIPDKGHKDNLFRTYVDLVYGNVNLYPNGPVDPFNNTPNAQGKIVDMTGKPVPNYEVRGLNSFAQKVSDNRVEAFKNLQIYYTGEKPGLVIGARIEEIVESVEEYKNRIEKTLTKLFDTFKHETLKTKLIKMLNSAGLFLWNEYDGINYSLILSISLLKSGIPFEEFNKIIQFKTLKRDGHNFENTNLLFYAVYFQEYELIEQILSKNIDRDINIQVTDIVNIKKEGRFTGTKNKPITLSLTPLECAVSKLDFREIIVNDESKLMLRHGNPLQNENFEKILQYIHKLIQKGAQFSTNMSHLAVTFWPLRIKKPDGSFDDTELDKVITYFKNKNIIIDKAKLFPSSKRLPINRSYVGPWKNTEEIAIYYDTIQDSLGLNFEHNLTKVIPEPTTRGGKRSTRVKRITKIKQNKKQKNLTLRKNKK